MIFLLVACTQDPPAPAEPPTLPTEGAVRVVEQPAGALLEVAADRYVHPDGGDVWVQGSVHVAEPVFYHQVVERLDARPRVFLELLVDDVEPRPPSASGTSLSLGLQHQSQIDVDRPGWTRRDLAESDLKAAMTSDGVSEALIHQFLVDEPGATRNDLPDDARGVALARLRHMHDVAAFDPDPVWRRYMLELRDEHLAAGVPIDGPSAVWFGAGHLPGIGRALVDDGWRHEERVWTAAFGASYEDMGLGPVQVRQLLKSWSEG